MRCFKFPEYSMITLREDNALRRWAVARRLFLSGLIFLLILVAAAESEAAKNRSGEERESRSPIPIPSGLAWSALPTHITSETLRQMDFAEKSPSFDFPARKARYLYNGLPDSHCIALTFDDGPNPRYTRAILGILREKKVPATFFLLGENVRRYHDIVCDIIASGCEVGNHSFSHANMRRFTPAQIREELNKTQEEIKSACGVAPRIVRFPYGVSSADVARVAFEMRLDIFFWSLDTDDYKKGVTKEDMVNTILKNAKDGSIILMHDRGQKEVDVVREIIDRIRAKGLEFVTCSEMAARVRVKRYIDGKTGASNPSPAVKKNTDKE